MKERVTRLKAVRKLLKNNRIDSQDTLLRHLQKEGFELTQATLSRDLKVLKVGKMSDGKGGYFYSLPDDGAPEETERTYVNDFLKGYISIDWSGNIVVVKTYSGHSDPVSLALDTFNFEEVLGTISGRDNTVAVFLREGASGDDFMRRMREKIPELE